MCNEYQNAIDFFSSLKNTDKVYLLFRHSIRRHITPEDSDSGAHVGLTEEGRKKAILLGKILPKEGDALYFSSPVGRCIDTAKCIAIGRDTPNELIKPLDILGHYFVKNYDAYLKVLNEKFYENICKWIKNNNHQAFYNGHL